MREPTAKTDPLGGHDPYSSSKGVRRTRHRRLSAQLLPHRGRGRDRHGARRQCHRRRRLGARPAGARMRCAPSPTAAEVRIRNPTRDPALAARSRPGNRLSRAGAASRRRRTGLCRRLEFRTRRGRRGIGAELIDRLVAAWGAGAGWRLDEAPHPPEAADLKLDCARAATRLGWRPLLELDRAIPLTTQWYRAFAAGADIRALTLGQIDETLARASDPGIAAGDGRPALAQAADLTNA